MNRIASLALLILCLIAAAFAVAFASWLRLSQQTATLRLVAVETKTHQLERALAMTQPASLPWDDSYLNDLGTLIDAQVSLVDASRPSPRFASGVWHFEYPLRNDNGQAPALLEVSFAPATAAKMAELYKHAAMILLVVALGLVAVLAVILLSHFSTRSLLAESSGTTSQIHREFDSLTHLAKVSATQRKELEHERNERLRADEDAHYQQVLLNRALEEKIQLGRELHDGIIQSLYATGLTLETAKKHLTSAPADAARELDAGLKSLNTTIRDVRSYINGLAPENIREQSFADSLQAMTQSLAAGRKVTFDLRIDESASRQLSNQQSIQLLQIVREAVSNSLRHGEASKVTVRLHADQGEIGLLVQDNGKGFDPAHAERGNGLTNIEARAGQIHATARFTSSTADGTRLVVTVPAILPAS